MVIKMLTENKVVCPWFKLQARQHPANNIIFDDVIGNAIEIVRFFLPCSTTRKQIAGEIF